MFPVTVVQQGYLWSFIYFCILPVTVWDWFFELWPDRWNSSPKYLLPAEALLWLCLFAFSSTKSISQDLVMVLHVAWIASSCLWLVPLFPSISDIVGKKLNHFGFLAVRFLWLKWILNLVCLFGAASFHSVLALATCLWDHLNTGSWTVTVKPGRKLWACWETAIDCQAYWGEPRVILWAVPTLGMTDPSQGHVWSHLLLA